MTFIDYSIKTRPLIEENLRKIIKEKNTGVFQKQKILEILEEFSLRGKLIRGILFLFSSEMFGLEINSKLIDIACAIELIHSSLLIHDDIIDRDFTRRKGKTVFAQYIEKGKEIKTSDPLHYGISIGIVAGDAALFLALELLAKYKKENLYEMLAFYANDLRLVALAEGLDSEYGQSDLNPDKEDIYSIYKYKTARYTFSLPLVMAGILANEDKKTLQILDEIGERAGIIFQLKDDEIGLFGDEETIGKPVGGDIRENKKTIIRALLYEKVNDEEKKFINKSFGNQNITLDDITKIKDLAIKYGILDSIKDDIDNIMDEIWSLFDNLKVKNEYKFILKDLLEFNLKRSY